MTKFGPTDAEYFLCGSPSFIDSLRSGLAEWGGPESRVNFESFSKPVAKTAAPVADNGAVSTAEIVFAKSGTTVTWTEGDGTLLEFAEDQQTLAVAPAFASPACAASKKGRSLMMNHPRVRRMTGRC